MKINWNYTLFITLLVSSYTTENIIINELNFDDLVNDCYEYVELYNPTNNNINLSDFYLVFYNGSNNRANSIIYLNNSYIEPFGYFLVGSSNTHPDVTFTDDCNTIQNGEAAAALYQNESGYVIDMIATNLNLVDALVYDKGSYNHIDELLRILTPEYQTIHGNYETFLGSTNKSISRCYGLDPFLLIQYTLTAVSPHSENICNFTNIVINELNADTPDECGEYVELYNPTNQDINLTDYYLVFYNGANNEEYYGKDQALTGIIQAFGYLIVGSSDVDPDIELPCNTIQNGEDAIALYQGRGNYIAPTGTNLIDAIVYDKNGGHHDSLTEVLTPGELTLHEDGQLAGNEENSLSRCYGFEARKLTLYALTSLSPRGPNNCSIVFDSTPVQPTLDPKLKPSNIVINEFNVDDSGQYVEIFDGGVGNTGLFGLVLVTYKSLGVVSNVWTLSNQEKTSSKGYFLIGTESLKPDFIINDNAIPQSGIDAIALYYVGDNFLQIGMVVTNQNLVDAVVYTTIEGGNSSESLLVKTLIPGQSAVYEDDNDIDDQSQSRCAGWKPIQTSSFKLLPHTPGEDNACVLPSIFLNEINVNQPELSVNGTHDAEFIELYDGGIGNQSLDGILVVLYNGNDESSYLTIDLNGYKTDGDGYFLIVPQGSTFNFDIQIPFSGQGFLQNGEDAICLHLASPLQFPDITPVTNFNLIDAIIYGTNDELDLKLLSVLLPGQDQLNELKSISEDDHSISRCKCCVQRNSSAFGLSPITPRAENSLECIQNNQTHIPSLPYFQALIRINEINPDQDSVDNDEFIELYDGGYGNVNLDGLIVALYSHDLRSYRHFNLEGYKTNNDGYFVIGSSSLTPLPDYTISVQSWLQNGPDAVTLYQGEEDDFIIGSGVTPDGLLDAIVYGSSYSKGQVLLDAFTPNQSLIFEDTQHNPDDESISRCYAMDAVNQLAFGLAIPSPGTSNIPTCSLPPLVINEIDPNQDGTDIAEFVELYSSGKPGFPLNNLVLVFYNGNTDLVYYSIELNGKKTDSNGYFLIGGPNVSVTPDIIIDKSGGFIQNGPDACALYLGKAADFPDDKMASNESLIDAIIYGKSESKPADPELVEILNPEQDAIVYDGGYEEAEESINRCDYEGKIVHLVSEITPKGINICPLNKTVKVIINEVSLLDDVQYIELWDYGIGNIPLDGILIVFYGEADKSIQVKDLSNKLTDSKGYFVIGTENVSPTPRIILQPGFLIKSYGAVALYNNTIENFPVDSLVTDKNLIDAVVFGHDGIIEEELGRVLLVTGETTLDSSKSTSVLSFERCCSIETRRTSAYSLGKFSPLALNFCSLEKTLVYINEVNSNNPGSPDSAEFIELYDGGLGNTPLSFMTLVLFNGNEDTAYYTFDLNDYSTNSEGYFLIGSSSIKPNPQIIIPFNDFLQNGVDGIGLYRAYFRSFPDGTEVTSISLIDGLVYGKPGSSSDDILLEALTPGKSVFVESDEEERDLSISRCVWNNVSDPDAYRLEIPSPLNSNNCSLTPTIHPDLKLLINEVNADNEGTDTQEYVEFFDQGIGLMSLDGVVMVFFSGHDDKSFFALDFTGYYTNQEGYFVVGSSSVVPLPDIVIEQNIQNGQDAIAIYTGSAADFPDSTLATKYNLIDAIVYSKNSDDISDNSLIEIFAPGQIQVYENEDHLIQDESVSRCLNFNPVDMSSYIMSVPTPGSKNNCTLHSIVINELNIGQPGTDNKYFIELYAGSYNYISLDTLVLVLFNGSTGESYFSQPLQNYRTDKYGYFLIGSPDVTNGVDIIVEEDIFLQNGVVAVALYRGNFLEYPIGMPVTKNQEELVDALVYGINEELVQELLDALLPGQRQISAEESFLNGNKSLSRCFCCQTMQISAFGLTHPTPQMPNNCPENFTLPTAFPLPTTLPPYIPQVFINEINSDTPGYDTREFIELFGPPNYDISNLVLVLYNGITMQSYYTVDFTDKAYSNNYKTDNYGYYVIGAANLSPPPDYALPDSDDNIIQNSLSAVALYIAQKEDFPDGTMVTVKHIVDALVYTDDKNNTNEILAKILNSAEFLEDEYFSSGDEAISRCSYSITIKNSDVYALSNPTPRGKNICPNNNYTDFIQMKLINASYDEWKEDNGKLVYELKLLIVDGIEQRCKCGFSMVYLTVDQVFSGSVIFQSQIQALSSVQLNKIISNYSLFIQETENLVINNAIYLVDTSCVADCKQPLQDNNSGGISGGIIAAIVISCFVFILIVSILLLYVKKKRKSGEFDTSTFVDSEFKCNSACELNDLKEIGNFDNPLYDFRNSKLGTTLIQE